MSRRALLALGLLFVALRLLLVLSAADRIHAPDWAEAKHSFLGDRWINEGPPSLSEVLAAARDSRNAAHGGFLPLSALYATLSVPLGTDDNQLALKLSALAFACLGFFAWLAVALRFGGALAGWLAALLLLFPPPIYLAGSLVTWGSHSEATALLGLATFLMIREQKPGLFGLVAPALTLGCVAAMSSLFVPIVIMLLLAWLWTRAPEVLTKGKLPTRESAVAVLLTSVPIILSWVVTGAPGSSVTEEAGNSPFQLLLAVGDGLSLLPRTLDALLPLPVFGPQFLDLKLSGTLLRSLDWTLSALLICALTQLVVGGHKESRSQQAMSLALLVGAPAVHLLVLLLIGPRRPSIELRYLLPLFPLALVAISVAAAWAVKRRRSLLTQLWTGLLLLSVVAWTLPGLSIQSSLLEPSRIGSLSGQGPGFFAWRSPRYIDFEIGNVRYETAPWVNDFLNDRGDAPHGFGLVPRLTAGQDLLRALEPPVIDAARLLDRIQRDRATQPPPGRERAHIYENIGWALAVFAPHQPGLWMSLNSHLGADRSACAAGLGMGLSRSDPKACEKIHALQQVDRYPAWAGAGRALSGFEANCSPPASDKHEAEENSEKR